MELRFKYVSFSFLICFIAGCFPVTPKRYTPQYPKHALYSTSEVDHVMELMGRVSQIKKWDIDARVALFGDYTEEDRRIVKQTLSLFNQQSTSTKFYLDNVSPTVRINFINAKEFIEHSRLPRTMNGQLLGVCGLRGNGLGLGKRSNIVIDKNLPQKLRNAVLRHELMHMIGFGHSSDKGSLMYPSSDGSHSFSSRDKAAIEILYREDVSDRMNIVDFLRTIGS